MGIIPLNNYSPINNKTYNSKSFKSKQNDSSNYNDFIKSTALNFIVEKKEPFIKTNTTHILNDFTGKILELKNSFCKLNKLDNKLVILETLVDKYYSENQIDKATALICELMNDIFESKNLSDKEKFDKIVSKKNISILNNYIKTTPFHHKNFERNKCNTKLMQVFSETINRIGYKEFLPYAETLCASKYEELAYDMPLNEYKAINKPARELINKHYDLDKLNTFLDKGKYYVSGMVETLSKWGLPKHSYILEKLANYSSYNKENRIAAIEAMGEIGNEKNIPLLRDFLFLKRNNIFYNDAIYNIAAFKALSNIDSPASKGIINSYINSYKTLFSKYNLQYFIKTICRDRDNGCIPYLKKILQNTKDTGTHKAVMDALCYIKTPEVNNFLISNLEENKRNYKKLNNILIALAHQDINKDSYNRIKSITPSADEFPNSCETERGDFIILIDRLRRMSENLEESLDPKTTIYKNDIFNINYLKDVQDAERTEINQYINTDKKEHLNKLAANAEDIWHMWNKNKNNFGYELISELFAKAFLRSNATWSDIKENVK